MALNGRGGEPVTDDAVGQPADSPICPRANENSSDSSSAGVAARPAQPLVDWFSAKKALSAGAEACYMEAHACARSARNCSDARMLESAENWRVSAKVIQAFIEQYESRSPDGDGQDEKAHPQQKAENGAQELAPPQADVHARQDSARSGPTTVSLQNAAGSEPADSHPICPTCAQPIGGWGLMAAQIKLLQKSAEPPSVDAVGQPAESPICPRANETSSDSSSAGIAARPALARPQDELIAKWRHKALVAGQYSVECPKELAQEAETEALVWNTCADELANWQGTLASALARPAWCHARLRDWLQTAIETLDDGELRGALREFLDADAENLAALARPAWQDIETAPNDGTWILVSEGINVWIAQWATPQSHSGSQMRGWRSASGMYSTHVTHWQALPPPPEGPERQK